VALSALGALMTGLFAVSARAQEPISLGKLHDAAMAHDPRSAMPQLLQSASALRERDIATRRQLQSGVNGQATYQSDVTALPISVPGTTVPKPPYARFQVTLDLEQPLYDAGAVSAQRAIERARLAEATSDVRSQLYRVKQEVNAALFGALLMQERLAELDATTAALDERLREARTRVAEGSALGRDTSALVAERYRLQEARAEVESSRRASLTVLSALTGQVLDPAVPLDLAAVSASMPDAQALLDDPTALRAVALDRRSRPEFDRFDATRARLDQEALALDVENRPRVSAFVQGGVGRPGLNQLVSDTDPFYLAGVRMSWHPFERQKVRRREEQVRVQQRMTDLEERSFAETIDRATAGDREEIARLTAARERDELLLLARSDVERVARVQYEEGAATAASWVSAQSDLLEARLQRRRHAVELEYARARLFTTLGVPFR
jgi:outer membrane protein TolC